MMLKIYPSMPRVGSRITQASLKRMLVTEASTTKGKPEGDISSVFLSLSGGKAAALPERFTHLKKRLSSGHEDQMSASWERLLEALRHEIAIVKQHGLKIIPVIDFKDISQAPESFRQDLRKRGVAVVRNVMSQEEAVQYQIDIEKYIRDNPLTKAFPAHDPQVFELYWSNPQIRARSHPNMTAVQRFLMSAWHSNDPNAPLSTKHPVTYADRLRIRQPGDSGFALGPHVDGGSVERWEDEGYGKGHVYDKIFQVRWEEYDPWESSCRIPVQSDLYGGAGACSMFRMFQGWLSMSSTGPGEGTLLVNPLLPLTTAYYLLRPFFASKNKLLSKDEHHEEEFLHFSNWTFQEPTTSELQGSNPGSCQELNRTLHPHLQLSDSMVHIPFVNPGDYVAWHCDTIHAVDPTHHGSAPSSVLYIPTCPLTLSNAQYLSNQRSAFLTGSPGPDFPGGKGESEHLGRPTEEVVRGISDGDGLRALGLRPWDEDGDRDGIVGRAELELLRGANVLLGF